MRRILAPLALLAVAALWTGCNSNSSSPKNAPPERNHATTTTTTTTAPAPPSNSNTSASNSNANTGPGGGPTGIKPPMKNEK